MHTIRSPGFHASPLAGQHSPSVAWLVNTVIAAYLLVVGLLVLFADLRWRG